MPTIPTLPVMGGVGLLLVCLSACGNGRSPMLADAQAFASEIRAEHRSADRVSFDLVISVRPEDGDPLNFTLFAWCDADHRTRLRATKLDVDFLDGLVEPDGRFTIGLVRSQEVVSGSLTELSIERSTETAEGTQQRSPMAFFADIGRIVDEAKNGPVPLGVSYSLAAGDDHHVLLTCHHDNGARSMVAVNRARQVVWKELYQDDNLIVRITYDRYQTIDRMQRPLVATLTFPDNDSVVRTRYRRLQRVPGFRPEIFSYAPPEDWQEISIDDFLKRLAETDDE